MSPRTFVTRGAALVALALGIAACETKTIVSPPPPDVVVTVTPATATLTATGQSVQFVALVTGVGTNGNTAVTWKSSNTAVATVAASGNTATVTAVANGPASIIATSVQDPTRSAAATVQVNIGTTGTTVPPTVSIASITTLGVLGNETPAVLSAINGTIVITANVDQGQGNTISAVNFNLGGKTVCSQTLTQGKSAGDATVQATSAVAFACQVKTDSIASGTPVFPNGNYTLTVSVVGPANAQLASASQGMTFANTDKLAIAFSAKNGPKLDASGLAWMGGDLTVNVTPAIFSGAANNISSVIITVNSTDSTGAASAIAPATVASATAGVFTATFPASKSPAKGGVQGIQGQVTITATSVTTAGQNGPSNVAFPGPNVFRLDNLPPFISVFKVPTPVVGTFPFLNGAFTFGSTSSPTNFTASDAGVDQVTATFQFASTDTTTTPWTTVTNASTIPQNNTAAYIVRAMVTDALGNSRIVYANNTGGSITAANVSAGGTLKFSQATAFGVDLAPPTITLNAGSLKDGTAVNAALLPLLSVAAADTGAQLSGVLGIQYKVVQFTSAATTCLTKNSSGSCVFGANAVATPNDFTTFTSGNTTTNTTLQVPTPAGGAFDSVYVQTVDLAGNTSTVIAMMVLNDNLAPSLGGLVGPAIITGGAAAAFNSSAADNLDLNKFAAVQSFGAVLVVNTTSATLGTFGLPLTTTATPTLTLSPFITSVETAAPAPAGASTNTSSLSASVTDQAGNASAASVLAFTAGSNISDQSAFTFGAAAVGVASWVQAAPTNLTVCNGTPNATGNVCGTVPTSTTLSVVATGPTATFLNPFTAVNFYYSQGGAPYTLIASTASASATDNGTNRTWTFSTVWTPAGITGSIAPGVATNVIAVGVDSKGHALMAAPVVVNIENALQ